MNEQWDATGTDGSGRQILAAVRAILERPKLNGASALPHVTLAFAQSLDGCITGEAGKPAQISCPKSMEFTHRLRRIHDAILVGVNTVLSDDPRLTVRLVSGESPRPVIVDSRLSIPADCRLLRSDGKAPIIATTDQADRDKANRLREMGAEVLFLPARADGFVELPRLFAELRQLGIASVMVEGGAAIITSTLADQLADQLVVTISPQFLSGMPALEASNGQAAALCSRIVERCWGQVGEDVVLQGRIELNGHAR